MSENNVRSVGAVLITDLILGVSGEIGRLVLLEQIVSKVFQFFFFPSVVVCRFR
jgi:hypothetical protein